MGGRVLIVAVGLLTACGEDDTGSKAEDTGCGEPSAWEADADGDGFGDPVTAREACGQPSGTVPAGGAADCDDGDASVNPGADELCNGIDDDCDGSVDEEPVDGAVWFFDGDGDGYGGDASATEPSCDTMPGDALALGGDCDDANPCVHPGAGEPCDGADSDCDGAVDEDCEACDNGVDDDKDGLLDCEDGDCFCGQGCGEICSDETDNDHDGLIDCEDEDCWGASCHPFGVQARVHGGHLAMNWVRESSADLDWVDMGHDLEWFGPQYLGWQVDASLRTVTGTVRVFAPSATAWGVDQPRTTCAWSFASGSFVNNVQTSHASFLPFDTSAQSPAELPTPSHAEFSLIELGEVARSGFTVDPACRLGGSWFLPPYVLQQVDGWGWEVEDFGWATHDWDIGLGGLWYQGSQLTSTSTSSPSWEPGSWSAGRWEHRAHGYASFSLDQPLPIENLSQAAVEVSGFGDVMAAGDFDSDGRHEVVVGGGWGLVLYMDDLDAGETARQTATLRSDGELDWIDSGHDLDGDGVHDLVVEPSSIYGTSIVSGSALVGLAGEFRVEDLARSTLVDTARGRIDRTHIIGDVTGDGVAELAVVSEEAAVYLLDTIDAGFVTVNARAAATFLGSEETLGFGAGLVADLDGDGVAELAFSEQGTGDEGVVWLWDATTTGQIDVSDADVAIVGPSHDLYPGIVVDVVGDVDGDGHGDLLVSFHGDDAVRLFAGPFVSTAVVEDARTSWPASDGFQDGTALGDLDGDGTTELSLERNETGPWTAQRNRRLVIFTDPPSGTLGVEDASLVLVAPYRPGSSDYDLDDVIVAGDQNDDGVEDLLVGTSSGYAWLWLMDEF